jgi:hypothetical protein
VSALRAALAAPGWALAVRASALAVQAWALPGWALPGWALAVQPWALPGWPLAAQGSALRVVVWRDVWSQPGSVAQAWQVAVA